MRRSKLAAIMAGIVFLVLSLATTASAQRYEGRGVGFIDPGTNIVVRTAEPINAGHSDGRIFRGVVDRDVRDGRGNILVPRGSNVEMMVRRISDNEMALDLDSLTIDGERYGVQSEENAVRANVVGDKWHTRGRNIDVPAESLVTFRLAAPLRAGVQDTGYMQNGYHYHHEYNSDRYPPQEAYRQKPGVYNNGQGRISVGSNNVVTWDAAQPANIYVQMDNDPPKLFASGQSGSQAAPWINRGHVYKFMLQDESGNVIAQDQVDLRGNSRR